MSKCALRRFRKVIAPWRFILTMMSRNVVLVPTKTCSRTRTSSARNRRVTRIQMMTRIGRIACCYRVVVGGDLDLSLVHPRMKMERFLVMIRTVFIRSHLNQ